MIAYSDASFNPNRKYAGIACVAVVGGKVLSYTTTCCAADVVEAELVGILENIQFVQRILPAWNKEDVILHSDCRIAVDMILKHKFVSSRYWSIVKKIRLSKGNFKIKWNNRNENGQADALAMLALRGKPMGAMHYAEPSFRI